MKTIKLSSASRTLAEYARELNGDIMVLTERNKAVAAIVPLKGVDRESVVLSAHPEFLKLITRARREFGTGKTLSFDEMKRAVLAPRKVNKRLERAARKRSRSTARR